MLIDWFTIVAQVLNFLILVWLLKRFLYRPILNAIDVREKRIAAAVTDADARKAEAQKEQDEFAGKNKAFDEQRDALLAKAIEDAKAERKRLVDEARKAADQVGQTQRAASSAHADQLNQALARRVQQEVFAITRKALADLASTSLEERVTDVFIKRLGELDDTTKKTLATALSASPDPAVLRTAFELPADRQAAIQKALNEAFATDIRVRFEATPAVISGIELSAAGQKLGWTIDGYLAALKESINAVFARQQAPPPVADAETVATPIAKAT